MKTEVAIEVLNRLDALAAKLGTTGTHLYAVLVKQAYVDAASSIFWGLVWVVPTAFLFYMASIRFYNYRQERDNDDFISSIIFGGVGFVFLTLVLYYFSDAVTTFINPDFWVLHYILHTLGGY